MWYVIQTFGGEEEKTANMIRKLVSPDCMEECFVPKRERMKKFHGRWNKVEEILFHGYVFVGSKSPDKLYEELDQIPKLTRILGKEEGYFLSLTQEEEAMVRGIGNQEHKTGVSKIEVLEGKRIRVIEGPLEGYVGNLVKVDLHKREVVVQVEFMGKQVKLHLGIELAGAKDGQ